LSVTAQATRPYCPGECAPYPFDAEARHWHSTFVVDITDDTKPFGVANFQVPHQPGNYCTRGARFGPHSTNTRLRPIYHKRVVFVAWFNAGDYELTIKVFDSPTSNLYNATTYHPIKGTDWCSQSDTAVAQLYGGYIHPDSTLHELHLIVSQWNTGTGPCHTVQDSPYHAMEFVTGVE
jgi:hypothetical protein